MGTKMDAWKKKAKLEIKAKLVENDISDTVLANELNENFGGAETTRSVTAKIDRGSFSHAFYLKCLKVIEIKKSKSGEFE